MAVMEAKELLRHQISDAGYQLNKVFEGVDSSLDFKLTPASMSPRETAIHLAECYTAALAEANGGKHEWGTYKPKSDDFQAIWAEMQELRAKASAAMMEATGQETHANAFIVAHDYYHVGQMAQLRLQREPSWDPYSIYNWG